MLDERARQKAELVSARVHAAEAMQAEKLRLQARLDAELGAMRNRVQLLQPRRAEGAA